MGVGILDGGRVDILVAMRSELNSTWRRPTAFSDPFGRLYLIEFGRASIEHGGTRRELVAGGLHAIPAHTPLSFDCPGHVVILWIHFNVATAAGMDLFHVMSCPLDIRPEDPDAAALEFQRVIRAAHGASIADEFERHAALLRLLALFAVHEDDTERRARLSGAERLRPALALLESRTAAQPSVPEMAKAVRMAPAAFSRLFTRCHGVSPARYALRRRIALAAGLLADGRRKLEDVASELGFADAFHLSKAFKKTTGKSPREYRSAAFSP